MWYLHLRGGIHIQLIFCHFKNLGSYGKKSVAKINIIDNNYNNAIRMNSKQRSVQNI